LYLVRQYSWSPTKISLALLAVTAPAAANPLIGRITARQGPRWWSVGGFVVCGAALISFGRATGHSDTSQTFFMIHLLAVGVALAVLINSNQVAISVASQRYGAAQARMTAKEEDLGPVLSWITASIMLSGVTTSWAAGILLGPAYSSLMVYVEDEGWQIFCSGLGALCFAAAVGSSFLWRVW
jgi:hypothetical protein